MRDWLDKVFPNGILGWGAWHIICHPWKAIPEIADRIRWAYQRVFRGYDDRVTWGIDNYLNEHMPTWLRVLKENDQGVPFECFPEGAWDEEKCRFAEGSDEIAERNWHAALDGMIAGFEAAKRLSDWDFEGREELDELRRVQNDGLALFVKYYGSLWD